MFREFFAYLHKPRSYLTCGHATHMIKKLRADNIRPQLVNKPLFLRERLHLQGDPTRVRHPLSASLTSPCTAGSHPLKKQSTGLFFNSPFAKRFEAICGVTPHSVGRCRAATKGTGLLSLPHTPPEALPLDSAKGTQSLWNPFHRLGDFFDRLEAEIIRPPTS